MKIITFITVLGLMTQVSVAYNTNGCSINRVAHFLNKARTDPDWAATRVQEIWIDNMVEYGNYGIALFPPAMLLYTGTVTWFEEAKYWLENSATACSASQDYVLDEGLTRAAYEHSVYQVDVGLMTHYQPADLTPNVQTVRNRSDLYNSMTGGSYSWAENIADCVGDFANNNAAAYGTTWEAEEYTVLSWIVDHNVASLGHRFNMFKCENTLAGIGIAPFVKSNGSLADRVTHMMVKGGYAANGYPFDSDMRDEICWTNYLANSNSCEPSDI